MQAFTGGKIASATDKRKVLTGAGIADDSQKHYTLVAYDIDLEDLEHNTPGLAKKTIYQSHVWMLAYNLVKFRDPKWGARLNRVYVCVPPLCPLT